MAKVITNQTYQVALYIRLSKEDERDGVSESVKNQQSMLEEYVRKNDLTVHDIYIDDGYSGTTFDRPAFQRMLCDIEHKRINMVITKDLSRLGRDYILTGHYMERYFPEQQVRYLSLLDGIDTAKDTSANDITPFRAIMNDMYAKDISKKIKSVKQDKQRKGQFIGGKPMYGYAMHPTAPNQIVVDTTAADIVNYIFSMALEGHSCRHIAQQLNDEHIACPSAYARLKVAHIGAFAGLWSSERIADMLQNEVYIGNMVQGRSVKISYKSKKVIKQPRDSWIVVPNTHEPIVSKETFDQVQRLLQSRKHTRTRKYEFPLKGLVYCHECGYPLGVVNRKNTKGEDVLYFICRTYQRFTAEHKCSCHSVKEQTIATAISEYVQMCIAQEVTEEELCQIAKQRLHQFADAQNSAQDSEKSAHKLAQIEEQIYQSYRDKLSGVLEESDFLYTYQRLREEKGRLQQCLIQRESTHSPDWTAISQDLVTQFLQELPKNRTLICSLFDRIEWSENKELFLYL